MSDLISREALIKWIDDSVSQYGHTYSTDMLNMWGLFKDYLINNAPTVFDCRSCKHNGNERECVDCHDYSNYVHYENRQQGEWIDHSYDEGYVECPFCEHLTNCEGDIDELHYCWNCGAKLEKGGAK